MLEQILILLLLFVFFLLAVLVERLKGRQRQAPREVRPPVPPVPVRTPRPVAPRVVGAQQPREALRSTPPPMSASPRGRSPRAQAYVGNQREVRRGIVLMTLLGPCRALEPPHPRQ
jgi:hypothetical protein